MKSTDFQNPTKGIVPTENKITSTGQPNLSIQFWIAKNPTSYLDQIITERWNPSDDYNKLWLFKFPMIGELLVNDEFVMEGYDY